MESLSSSWSSQKVLLYHLRPYLLVFKWAASEGMKDCVDLLTMNRLFGSFGSRLVEELRCPFYRNLHSYQRTATQEQLFLIPSGLPEVCCLFILFTVSSSFTILGRAEGKRCRRQTLNLSPVGSRIMYHRWLLFWSLICQQMSHQAVLTRHKESFLIYKRLVLVC